MLSMAVAGATILLLSARAETRTSAAQLPRDTTVRLVPDDLRGHGVAPRLRDAQVKAVAGVAAFHDFQFTDRLADERHLLQAPRRRRRGQHLQGGPLRSRQRHRDRGCRRRRPDRHLLRQPGWRQPALEECRGRQVSGHHGGGRRRGGGQGRRLRLVCRHRQRRRRRPLRHDGPRRQRALRERRPRPLPRHLGVVGSQLRRATRRAPCSSTTTATAGSTCSSSTSDGTRRRRSRAPATSTTWRSRTRFPAT